MIRTVQLAQIILEKWAPQQSAARLALYHYLKNERSPEEAIDVPLLNHFFLRCLTFEHWQSHFNALEEGLSDIIHSLKNEIPDIADLRYPSQRTLIRLKNPQDTIDCLQRFLKAQLSPKDNVRIFSPEKGLWAAVILYESQALRYVVFHPLFTVSKGILLPLTMLTELRYTDQLELIADHRHRLALSPFQTAIFRANGQGQFFGNVIRGYTFQKYQSLEGKKLSSYPQLFYAIKRCEQSFIKRESDPLYQELLELLERSAEMLEAQHPQAQHYAEMALEKGRLALQQIYPDDKLMKLLLKNLETTWQEHRIEPPQRPRGPENSMIDI